jgi:ABC-type nitrate/sulfonate/bicarbonate transport system permease component
MPSSSALVTGLPPARLFKRVKSVFGDSAGAFLVGACVLTAWQLATSFGSISPFLLPAPTAVSGQLIRDLSSGVFYHEVQLSIFRALASFFLAATAGIAIGLAMRASKIVSWMLTPMISVALPLPKIALLPVFMVWFGLFDLGKIALTTFSAIFVIIIATSTAATKVDTTLIWSARNFGADRRQVLVDVILPASLPTIYSALQVAFPICLVVTFVAEMVMGGQGLGARMIINARNANSPAVFAGIIEIAVVGNCLIGLMQVLRGRILYWMPS